MSESRWAKWVDRAVGVFSPYRAALRAHFRRMENDRQYREEWFAAMRARGYRAARSNATQTPWLGGGADADSHVRHDLATLCQRSQELNRDDPLASGLTKTFTNNVVGTGIIAQANTGEEGTDDLLESVWEERRNVLFPAENLGESAAQRLIFRKVFEDGGIFVKRMKPRPEVPVAFEMCEKARCTTPRGAVPVVTGGRIEDGVEKDAFGVPIAYWILKAGTTGLGKEDFVRVPAAYCRHLRLIERPGQTHGVPAFHAVLQDLRDLDLLLLASLKRTQIAACLAAFIKTPRNLEAAFDLTAQKYGYQLDQQIEPGMIFRLYPEEEIQNLIPNFPTPELGPFIVMLARRIGAALGVSWQIVLKDFSESTYSSARTDLLEARVIYVVLQKWLIEECLTWLWTSVMEDAVLRGDPRLDGVKRAQLSAVTLIPPGWRWVDPVKEAQGVEIELRLKITTLREVCASQGKDWRETLRQRLVEEAYERDLRTELGLPAATAAAPASASVQQTDSRPDRDDEDEDRPRRRTAVLTGGTR